MNGTWPSLQLRQEVCVWGFVRVRNHAGLKCLRTFSLHSYRYLDHGIEGLTSGPLDFSVMCLIRRHTEKRGGEVCSGLLLSKSMWPDMVLALLRQGGQGRSFKDTVRDSFKRCALSEKCCTQDCWLGWCSRQHLGVVAAFKNMKVEWRHHLWKIKINHWKRL